MPFGVVSNIKGNNAPRPRYWVSDINQNRAKDIQNMKERQTTKYASLKFTSVAGTTKAVRGNSNNTITGSNAPLNVFDKTAGVIPVYTKVFTPPYIIPAKFSISGIVPTTDAEWIIWKGTKQLVQIDGSISIAPTDSNSSIIRLQIHINDKMVGDVKVNGANDQIPQLAEVEPVRQFNSGNITKQIKVSYRGYIDADYTIKLMTDRLDSTSPINMNIHTATLDIKTLPMS